MPVRRLGASCWWGAGFCLLLAAMVVGCQRLTAIPSTSTADSKLVPADSPIQAVRLPTQLLRHNDLAGFAQLAIPASLQPALQQAWLEGRTHWPLDELPFSQRLPQLLQALGGPGAQTRLQRGFDRQFAGADQELRGAARALGLFGAQYLQREAGFSPTERNHYTQLVRAMSQWAAGAELGDRRRGAVAIRRMTQAARATGLSSQADFRRLGMQRSLAALGPFVAAGKQTLADYGLALDPALDAMQITLIRQQGDQATVRMRYRLGGTTIDAPIPVERIDGHWYVSDFVRHARESVAPAHIAPASTAPASPPSA